MGHGRPRLPATVIGSETTSPKIAAVQFKAVVLVDVAYGCVARGLDDAGAQFRVIGAQSLQDELQELVLHPKSKHPTTNRQSCDLACFNDERTHQAVVAKTI